MDGSDHAQMFQFIEYQTAKWEVVGLNSDWMTTQGLKITEQQVLRL